MSSRRETTKALAAMMTAGFPALFGVPGLAKAPGSASAPVSDTEPATRVHEVIRHSLSDLEGKVATLVTVSYALGRLPSRIGIPGPSSDNILEGAVVSQVEPGPPITRHHVRPTGRSTAENAETQCRCDAPNTLNDHIE